MRVSSLFLVLLMLVSFCALQATAQPPRRNATVLILHQDDSCAGDQWVGTALIEEASSPNCVAGQPGERGANSSFIFECSTTTDTTTMRLSFYNNTRACDNTAETEITSSGSPHTCAPISIAVMGGKYAISGHVECDVTASQQMAVSSYDFVHSVAQRLQTAPVKAAPVKKSRFSQLFQ